MNDGPFAFLYTGTRHELKVPNYAPPERFPHGDWVLVAECPKSPPDGDGQDVRVYESRLPATFWKIEALATPNSMGEPARPFALSTGTMSRELVEQLVEAITTGILGLAE